MGDRIVVMKDGFIQQVAPPLELYDQPANQFVAGFIGSPPMNFFKGRLEQKSGGIWFNEGHFSIRVDEHQARHLHDQVGRDIVFGIRPEDVAEASTVTDPNPEHVIKARVEVVEPMGAETYLYMTTGKNNFIARVNGSAQAVVNQELKLVLTLKKGHFFHGESGATLV